MTTNSNSSLTLLEAAKLLRFSTVKVLVEQKFYDDEAFLTDINNRYTDQELVWLYETLINAGHPFPLGKHGENVLKKLCSFPEKYWDTTLPLLEKVFNTQDYNFRETGQFLIAGNELSANGNLEALKILLPPTTTLEQLQYLYEGVEDQGFTSYTLRGRKTSDNDLDQKNYACLSYLLDLFPEKVWQKLGCQSQWQQSIVVNGKRQEQIMEVLQPSLVSKAACLGSKNLLKWLVNRGHSINPHKEAIYWADDLNFNSFANPISCLIANNPPKLINHILPVLFELGCEPTFNALQNFVKTSSEPSSPINIAIKCNFSYLIPLLADHGADLNGIDKNGKTPLASAALNNDSTAVELLIKSGANLDLPSENGNTPIAFACLGGSLESFILLYEAGATLDTKNDFGSSPEDILSIPIVTPNSNSAIKAFLELKRMDENTNPASNKKRIPRL